MRMTRDRVLLADLQEVRIAGGEKEKGQQGWPFQLLVIRNLNGDYLEQAH